MKNCTPYSALAGTVLAALSFSPAQKATSDKPLTEGELLKQIETLNPIKGGATPSPATPSPANNDPCSRPARIHSEQAC